MNRTGYDNSLCVKCNNDVCKVYGGRCKKYRIIYFFKKLFCKHKNNDVVCWHWTHGYNANEIRFLEIQLRCKDCGKYHFAEIRDWKECYKFIEKYKDKQWSDACQPVL